MTDLTPIPNSALPIDPPRGEGVLWNVHHLRASAEATPEHIIERPEYWQHVAAGFVPGDHVRVQSVAGLYDIEVLVRWVAPSKNAAGVVPLSVWREPKPDVVEAGGMSVTWRGETARWCLVMTAGGDVVRDGFRTRTEASDVLKAMTAPRPAKAAKTAA